MHLVNKDTVLILCVDFRTRFFGNAYVYFFKLQYYRTSKPCHSKSCGNLSFCGVLQVSVRLKVGVMVKVAHNQNKMIKVTLRVSFKCWAIML